MSTVLSGVVTAEWRDIVMLSYEVDPLLLVPFVPRGTSLDFHDNRAVVSIVGLRLLNTRVAGVLLPFHQDLEQVNFRFYVWRRQGAELRRGVVFLKEIVPSVVMTMGARLLFNEKYGTATMRHKVTPVEQGTAAYEWSTGGRWNRVAAKYHGPPTQPHPHSLEAFIKERPWGYSRRPDGSALEYHVEHPSWDVRAAAEPVLDCDVAAAFGRQFTTTLARPPISAFIAVGSEATVHAGVPID